MKKIQIIEKIKNKKIRGKIANDLCDDCLYKAIREVAINTKNGNIKVSPKVKNKLKSNKKIILELAKKEKSNNKRRKLVVQSGGFLQLILPALIATLGAVANWSTRKKLKLLQKKQIYESTQTN